MQSGFPYASQVFRLTREWTDKKKGTDHKASRLFITSLDESAASKRELMQYTRGHWSVENKNHWKRDSRVWEEDKCLHRRSAPAQNLALLRNTLLALVPASLGSLSAALEYYRDNKAQAIALLSSISFA